MADENTWYSAHIIFYYEKLFNNQDSYLVHENIYLIKSLDWQEAESIAIQIGLENQDLNENGHLELNEEKVSYKYAGVRKIIEVEIQPENNKFSANPSGVEVSYSEFEVDTLDEVKALARGEMVNVLYRE